MRIGLLGTVEVLPGPVPLSGVRLRGLLARLALDAGRPVGTSVLVDDLWGERPPDGAGNALQALVSRLRRAIGADLVVTVPGGYRLRLDPDAVDALRFDALVSAAGNGAGPARAHALLHEALGLWRGQALADVGELPFAEPATTRLTERRADAVERSAQLALRLGAPTDAERAALAAQLAAAPLRESTAALLARCLHAAGRQADALAVLDRTVALLADELGVDPGPELSATRMDVLRGAAADPVAPDPAPAAALSSFVGRAGDLGRIRSLLGGHRLVTLTGPGGAGKTRLAHEVVDGSGRRVRVAELAPLTDPDQLPAALLAAAGEPELQLRTQDEPAPDTTARLVSALGGPGTLLVLDNCEHLVDAVATLTETLLLACPALRVLATSREPLGVPGEVLHPVDALPVAEAVRLFADRAAAVRPGFALTPELEPVVADVCRRLDGQPLPIELAAARTRTLTPAEIAARLDDRFRLLTSGARTALPRHQTLRAVVDWSWELLAEPERAVARRLGAFAGGATAAAAERVCAAPGGPAPDEVFDLLAALVDKSLVVAAPQPGAPTRYRMLETIRAYAVERLDESGERAAAEAAHLAVVLELVEAAEPRVRGAEQLEWLARLRAEAEEIEVALRRAVAAGDAQAAYRLVAGLGWPWMMRGLVDEYRRWLDAVAPLEGPVPAPTRALVASYLGVSRIAANEPDADALFRVATALVEAVPRPRHPVLDLVGPAYALFTDRDAAPIRRLADDTDDPWLRAVALQVQGVVAENDGRIDEQRQLQRASRNLFSAVGDRFGLGMAVHALGELEDLAGDAAAAAAAYDEAIRLAADLGNDDLVQFLCRRARLDARRGDAASAQAVLERAAASDDSVASRWLVLVTRAELACIEGDVAAARAALRQLGAGFSELEPALGIAAPQRRAMVAALTAAVELLDGDVAGACGPLADAVRAAQEGQDGPVSALVAELVARVLLAGGDPDGAAVALGVAFTQRGALDRGDPSLVAALAAVDDALGPAAAGEAMRRGRELSRDGGLDVLERAVDGAAQARRR